MKLGFVTATFNRPELLARLHFSFANEDLEFDWEHYVVDDGSVLNYTSSIARCDFETGRIKYSKIPNSGPLIARNRALECALLDGCTHICFVDDDDVLLKGALEVIVKRLSQFNHCDWFIFKSENPLNEKINWPINPTEASWFDDVVLRRKFGNDNLMVISAALIGKTRFSKVVRNQREWKFFLALSKKNGKVMVLPESALQKNYQTDGLTAAAHGAGYNFSQAYNGLDRAISYWMRKPTSAILVARLFRQCALFPAKALLSLFNAVR